MGGKNYREAVSFNDSNGELIAATAGASVSLLGVARLEENLSVEDSYERRVAIEALACLMGTQDINNMQNKRRFYLQGAEAIKARARACKQHFLQQRKASSKESTYTPSTNGLNQPKADTDINDSHLNNKVPLLR